MKLIIILLCLFCLTNSLTSQQKFNFKEDKIEKVFDSFFKVKFPEKSEFETKEEYLQRFPKPDTSKRYLFPVDVFTFYNIEDSTFTLSILDFDETESSSFNVEEMKTVHYITNCKLKIKSNIKEFKPYTTSNSFGTKVKVTPYHLAQYYLDTLKINRISVKHNDLIAEVNKDKFWVKYGTEDYKSIDITLKLIPEVAKKHSKNVSASLRVKFFSYTDRDYYYDELEPTMSNPMEAIIEKFYLKSIIDKIIFYNKKTKEIIAEVNIIN